MLLWSLVQAWSTEWGNSTTNKKQTKKKDTKSKKLRLHLMHISEIKNQWLWLQYFPRMPQYRSYTKSGELT